MNLQHPRRSRRHPPLLGTETRPHRRLPGGPESVQWTEETRSRLGRHFTSVPKVQGPSRLKGGTVGITTSTERVTRGRVSEPVRRRSPGGTILLFSHGPPTPFSTGTFFLLGTKKKEKYRQPSRIGK